MRRLKLIRGGARRETGPTYFRELLAARNDRWRRHMTDLGLDPDHEKERAIRRSLERHDLARSPIIVERPSWLARIIRRVRGGSSVV